MTAVTVGVLAIVAGVFLLLGVNALLGAFVVVLGVLTIGSAVREWRATAKTRCRRSRSRALSATASD